MTARLLLASLVLSAAVSPAADPPRQVKLGGQPVQTLGEGWVALSRDGKELVYRTGPDTLGLFDPLTGKPLREVRIEQKEIGEQLWYAADGRHLLFKGTATLRRVDAATGKVVAAIDAGKFAST